MRWIVMELIEKGGFIIYPLLLFSLVSLTIILERLFIYIRISRQISDQLMEEIKEKLKNRDIKGALMLLDKIKGPVGKILKKGIENFQCKPEEIEKEMEEVELAEFPVLEKRMDILHFIANISPTLGLLGTVTGMIKTFQVLSFNANPQELAVGISEALITTAMGLVISIPSFAAYHYFINKIDYLRLHTEKRQIELINYLKKVGFNSEISC
jgi:biopolymer transport protein ExbB